MGKVGWAFTLSIESAILEENEVIEGVAGRVR